jgi:hypothetical protein
LIYYIRLLKAATKAPESNGQLTVLLLYRVGIGSVDPIQPGEGGQVWLSRPGPIQFIRLDHPITALCLYLDQYRRIYRVNLKPKPLFPKGVRFSLNDILRVVNYNIPVGMACALSVFIRAGTRKSLKVTSVSLTNTKA